MEPKTKTNLHWLFNAANDDGGPPPPTVEPVAPLGSLWAWVGKIMLTAAAVILCGLVAAYGV